MPKRTSKKIPSGAIILRTYEALFREVDAFSHRERSLLIVVGPPGTAKSTAARRHLTKARTLEGGVTPYRLYIELYENRDLPIILDDADKIFSTRDGVFLLKLLTQTTTTKTIQWNSNTAEIRAKELPAEFTTTSRVLIIANSWPQENPDIKAIESRGHLYYFAPSAHEIHSYAGTFFEDKEVYDFIGQHLPLFDQLDLRIYHKTKEIKSSDLRTGDTENWKRYVRGHLMEGEKRVAFDLLQDKGYSSDHKRAKEFRRITGMSERTFYLYRDQIALRFSTQE